MITQTKDSILQHSLKTMFFSYLTNKKNKKGNMTMAEAGKDAIAPKELISNPGDLQSNDHNNIYKL